jgi:DNA processing protein
MDQKLLTSWLRLVFTPRVGPKTFLQLLEKFQEPERVFDNLPEIKKLYKLDLQIPSLAAIEDIIAATYAFGGEILIAIDPNYPSLLKEIPHYPLVLFTKGDLSLLKRQIIAIVGTRNSSLSGEKITKTIATDLGKAGLVTVSGLARGIDSAVHKSSLTTGTIGVIASGLNCFYPKENQALQEELFEKGLVITESSMGSVPLAQNFPRRNRIISGLSLGVLIAEAQKNSGTMITANYALEQGREVFAIPGSPLDSRAEGTNWLIKNGAILTRNAEDILLELHLLPLFKKAEEAKITQDLNDSLDTPQNLLLSKISHHPLDLDELFNELDLSPADFQQLVIELELLGKIIKKGNKISLI